MSPFFKHWLKQHVAKNYKPAQRKKNIRHPYGYKIIHMAVISVILPD